MRSPPPPSSAFSRDLADGAETAVVTEPPRASDGWRSGWVMARERADGPGAAETFELHFRQAQAISRIEVVTCLRRDLIHRIRALPDPPHDEVEVRRSGELLFTLLR